MLQDDDGYNRMSLNVSLDSHNDTFAHIIKISLLSPPSLLPITSILERRQEKLCFKNWSWTSGLVASPDLAVSQISRNTQLIFKTV